MMKRDVKKKALVTLITSTLKNVNLSVDNFIISHSESDCKPLRAILRGLQ